MQSTSNARTVWVITTATGAGKAGDGPSYYANTYPDSDHVFLEKYESGRVVAPGQARKLLPLVRAAIEAAKAGLTQQGA